MSGTKRSKSKKRAAERVGVAARMASVFSGWSIAGVATWLNRGLLAAIVIAAGVGLAFGYAPLRERVAEARSDPIVIEFEWPALASPPASDDAEEAGPRTWLPAHERDRLTELVAAMVSQDPFDQASLARARAALDATGWFAEPPRVVRRPGGTVRVSGEWRLPAAVVRRSEWDYLVSSGGRLLPIRYATGAAAGVPVIAHTFSGPPIDETGAPAYGESWSGGDVHASLSLIRLLEDRAGWSEIAYVDASDYVRRGSLSLVTHDGGVLIWGAPPGAEAPGEVSDATKAERVGRVLSNPAWNNAQRPPVDLSLPQLLIDRSAGGGG